MRRNIIKGKTRARRASPPSFASPWNRAYSPSG
jgi:hypothetical protein